MTDPGASSAALAVTLQVAEQVVVGTSVLATLRVANRGSRAVAVSSRLNLMEGDVQLLVTCPGGATRVVAGAGGQPDTALRQVSLAPGQQIAAAFNLLDTSVGALFTEPGSYSLQAKYWPTPGDEPVASPAVTVAARAPNTDAERGAAALLQDEAARRALVLGESESAPDALRRLADGFAGTPDGELASLLLAGGALAAGEQADARTDVFRASDPETVALRLTALATPFNHTAPLLTDAFAASWASPRDAPDTDAAASAVPDRALQIARGQPFTP
jgi:uncharacterized protein YjeT (DUF2065 family)